MTFHRVPDPPRREGQYPTDIELLLRDYSRAREEAKTEIARVRVRLRERTEQEKRRLEQQALTQSVKVSSKCNTQTNWHLKVLFYIYKYHSLE